jgi:hypothetical protein
MKIITIDIGEIILKYFVGCHDFDNLILKGHLLIEHKMEETINKLSYQKLKNFDNISFFTKIQILKIIGIFLVDETIFEDEAKAKNNLQEKIKILNNLRNSLAHNLNYDKNKLENFINAFDQTEVDKTIETNGKDFSQKKHFLQYILGISQMYTSLRVYEEVLLYKRKHSRTDYRDIFNKLSLNRIPIRKYIK